jgi:hypothetical protein
LQYGFTLRNFMALQVLDILWRQVISGSGLAVISNTQGQSATSVCSGALPIRLTVGQPARVTPGAANNIRSAPSLSAQKIGQIPGEAGFSVLEGPVCGDGLNYWRVSYNGIIGWTAEGNDQEYWVEPSGG